LPPERVLEQRYLHRMTVAAALPTAARGGLAGRPRATDSGVDGVFLAGDWVGPDGHLLDASVASAEAAVGAALAAARLTLR
jgi:phytoene dehydrogenase-like protein